MAFYFNKVVASFSLIILLISASYARNNNSLEKHFLILKKIPADYQSFGSICEQVARLRLKERFDPKKFEFIIGLEYRNFRRTLGEVDLLVVSKKSEKVFVVGEVKCWKNLDAAIVKAKKQLKRFFKAMNSSEKITFHPKEKTNIKFKKESFLKAKEIMYSQKTDDENPFLNDIGLTLYQVKTLRKKLQQCQKNKKCPVLN